jgi:hypothetical protein
MSKGSLDNKRFKSSNENSRGQEATSNKDRKGLEISRLGKFSEKASQKREIETELEQTFTNVQRNTGLST